MTFGWFMMLPDDFENMAQSVIATNFFANNILESITTKNYWDVGNDYKPLMHTWYVGLLMQFYLVIPFIIFIVGRFIHDVYRRRKVTILCLSIIAVTSLILNLLSNDACSKFYYLQFRLYEFCAGSIAFYLFCNEKNKFTRSIAVEVIYCSLYFIILIILFVENDFISSQFRLFLIVILSTVLIVMMSRVKISQNALFSNKWIAAVGASSYSIFVWHQVIFAFARYSFTNNLMGVVPLLSVTFLTIIVSAFSYKYIETIKTSKMIVASSCMLVILTTVISLYVYSNAGVVRDVPELEVFRRNVHRGMWAEYCDRRYEYDKDFSNSVTPKWYVIGNSFGRDMVNVIAESDVLDMVEVSYSDVGKYQNEKGRFSKADVVFLSTLGLNEKLINDVQSYCHGRTKLYIIGEKNFGENNGQIYRHRYSDDYHSLTVRMEDGYEEKNNWMKSRYCNIYVDMIEMVKTPNGKVRVFTDDNHFISQDCRHLTKAGARFYAKRMDWNRFLLKE